MLVETEEQIDIRFDLRALLQVRKLPVPPDTPLLNDVISCVVVTLRPLQLAGGLSKYADVPKPVHQGCPTSICSLVTVRFALATVMTLNIMGITLNC